MARLPLAVLALALLGLLPETTLAQRRPHRPATADETLRPDVRARVRTADTLTAFRTRTVRRHGTRGRLDVEAGVLRALYRIESQTDVGADAEATARAYLAEQAEAFGLDSTLADLETDRVQAGRHSAHVVFRQTFRGVPVYGRRVKVNLDRQGRPSMVFSGYAPGLARTTGFNPQPAYAAAEAQTRAEALLDGPARTSEPELVVYPSDQPQLAWRLLAWPEAGSAEWEVLLDAHTGEPIQLLDQTTHRGGEEGRRGRGVEEERSREERRKGGKEEWATGSARLDVERGPSVTTSTPHLSPFAMHPPSLFPLPPSPGNARVDGSGLVFDPDPLTSAGQPYEAPFLDGDDAGTPELDAQRKEVPLRDITRGRDGLYRLEGPYVRITGEAGVGGTAYAPPAERRPDAFRYGRADDAFEAVMAYYHVDASQRYVQALGLDRAILEEPVRVNPHGLGDFDDSKFYPGQNALAFGRGGVDDAEDADVVRHEYAHALLESSAPGLLNTTEGQALHEGWADYWAASYSRALIEGGRVPEGDWRRLFPWDGNNGCWQGRTLDHGGRYPDDVDVPAEPGCGQMGYIYRLGVLWATTLMEVYDDLGRETTDRLNLHSHAYLSAPVTMQDAAEALLQADEDLYGGAHLGVLLGRLGTRGFVDVGAYGPVIVHEPLAATEQRGGTVAFEVGVTGPTAEVERVSVFYGTGGAFTELALAASADDVFSGALPLPTAPGTVAYYIEATDELGRLARRPAGAPSALYRFDVGADQTSPPEAPRLDAIRPNPFSGRATIAYRLPEATDVRLEVYDLLGRRVAVLAEGERSARTHTVTLDGSGLASGVYLVRLLAGDRQDTRQVVVVR